MTVTKEYLQEKYKNYIKINELKNGKYFIYQKRKTNCDYFNFVTNDLEKADKKINKWIYKNYNQIISDEVKQNNSSITVTCEIDIPECVKIKRLILIFRLKTYEKVLKVYSDG